jgi:hypothetical protein
VNWMIGAGRRQERRNILVAVGPATKAAERSEAEWGRVRAAVLRALEPFEDARDAVYAALIAQRDVPADVPS